MRSASSTASSILWVTMKMPRVGIFFGEPQIEKFAAKVSAVSTSSAEKGSSMKRISGLDRERTREADALLHSAGEFLWERALETFQPDGGERTAARCGGVRHDAVPRASNGASTFSRTVSHGKSAKL